MRACRLFRWWGCRTGRAGDRHASVAPQTEEKPSKRGVYLRPSIIVAIELAILKGLLCPDEFVVTGHQH